MGRLISRTSQPSCLQPLHGARDQRRRFRSCKSLQILARQAELQPFHVAVERGRIIRHGRGRRSGIAWVAAGDHAQQRRGILHRAREGADVIERTGERRQARSATRARRSA